MAAASFLGAFGHLELGNLGAGLRTSLKTGRDTAQGKVVRPSAIACASFAASEPSTFANVRSCRNLVTSLIDYNQL